MYICKIDVFFHELPIQKRKMENNTESSTSEASSNQLGGLPTSHSATSSPLDNNQILEESVEPDTLHDDVLRILKSIDWQRFVNLCASIGNDFNSPQWRFMKAVIFETSLEVYSNGQLKYVGEEETGCDFRVPTLNNVKIEMKYTEEALFSGKQSTSRNMCKSITLLNSKGTNTHSNLPEHYADYLLIVERRGAALISKENLKKHVVSNGDSLSAKIPCSELSFVFTPNDVVQPENVTSINIKKTVLAAINSAISSY